MLFYFMIKALFVYDVENHAKNGSFSFSKKLHIRLKQLVST